MGYLLGFDLGGTKSAAILGRRDGDGVHIVAREAVKSDLAVPATAFLSALCGIAEALMAGSGVSTRDLDGIGVSCGGPLDSKLGVIQSPPNLPGWDDVPVTDMLKHRFGRPAHLQNDANACAVAEWQFGAAKGCDNAIFLTFGTGMGAGLILNGRPYEGASGMAGEAGHIRLATHGPVGYGKQGSFEGFCSGGGIAQLAGAMALERLQRGEQVTYCRDIRKLGAITAKSVGEAADAGDGLALEVFRVCGQYLGQGLAILIDLLNPDVIVLGSIYARREALLRDAAMEELRREALAQSLNACRIVPAALGEQIGDYAALAVAGGGY